MFSATAFVGRQSGGVCGVGLLYFPPALISRYPSENQKQD